MYVSISVFSGSRIQQCSTLNTIHVNCNHRIHHSFPFYARCGHQLVSRCMFVTDRCMMSSAADLAARTAFALRSAVSTSCAIKTQLFQTELLPAVSNCHELVTIYSFVVSCVTIDTPSLCWRCFVSSLIKLNNSLSDTSSDFFLLDMIKAIFSH